MNTISTISELPLDFSVDRVLIEFGPRKREYPIAPHIERAITCKNPQPEKLFGGESFFPVLNKPEGIITKNSLTIQAATIQEILRVLESNDAPSVVFTDPRERPTDNDNETIAARLLDILNVTEVRMHPTNKVPNENDVSHFGITINDAIGEWRDTSTRGSNLYFLSQHAIMKSKIVAALQRCV